MLFNFSIWVRLTQSFSYFFIFLIFRNLITENLTHSKLGLELKVKFTETHCFGFFCCRCRLDKENQESSRRENWQRRLRVQSLLQVISWASYNAMWSHFLQTLSESIVGLQQGLPPLQRLFIWCKFRSIKRFGTCLTNLRQFSFPNCFSLENINATMNSWLDKGNIVTVLIISS